MLKTLCEELRWEEHSKTGVSLRGNGLGSGDRKVEEMKENGWWQAGILVYKVEEGRWKGHVEGGCEPNCQYPL